MRNGFLYITIKFILDNFRHLTLVEWFKKIGYKILCNNPNDPNEQADYRSNIVDFFNVIKWSIIICLLCFSWTNCFLTFLVWYLLVTNVYSYFYHHIWSDDAYNAVNLGADRARRRFMLLMLSVAYSDFCFAYLYYLPYNSSFTWTNGASFTKAIWFSVSNSLAANYSVVTILSDIGNTIAMVQLILTFIFVTIIISRSIPQGD